MTETSVRLRARATSPYSATSLHSVPTAVCLTLILGVSAAVRFAFAAALPSPVIFTDELIYADLARSIGSSGEFLVRETPFPAWTYGPLYAAVIAPVFTLPPVIAYTLAKAINCLLISLAAVPVYFLARRLVDRSAALVASSLAVLIPSVAYSARVMTESLAYPVFLVALLAMVACLERPTLRRQGLLLLAVVAATLSRSQAIVLVPALPAAAALYAFADLRASGGRVSFGSVLGRLRAFNPLWMAGLLGMAVALAASVLRSGSPGSLLGAHGVLLDRFQVLHVPEWSLYNTAGLALVVGVLPLASFLLLTFAVLVRGEHPHARPLFAVSVAVTALLLVMIALYSTQIGAQSRFHERYLFYLEPLFLISLLGWVRSDVSKIGRRGTAVILATASLPIVFLFAPIAWRAWDAPGLALWVSIRRGTSDGVLLLVVLGLAASAYLLVRAHARRLALTSVTLFLCAASLAAGATFRSESREAVAAAGYGERTWIDDLVGPGARVSILWTGSREQWRRYRAVFVNEFFNRSVRDVYFVSAVPLELYETRLRRNAGTLVLPDGEPLRTGYVLSDGPEVVGRRVASKPAASLTLYRVDNPVRLVGEAH